MSDVKTAIKSDLRKIIYTWLSDVDFFVNSKLTKDEVEISVKHLIKDIMVYIDE